MRSMGIAVALVMGASVVPVGTADAAAKPPVVKIALSGDNGGKVSGAKGLRAGWVTLRLTATDAAIHDVYLGSARHGAASKTKGIRAPQGIRRVQGRQSADAPPGGASGPSQAELYAQQAQATRNSEAAALAPGGARVTRARGVDLTVSLPAGTVVLFGQLGQIAELKVAKGTGAARPTHSDSRITEGANNVIHAPATLPRNGTLRIDNTTPGGFRVHSFLLGRLTKKTTKAALQKYFGPDADYSAPDPFNDFPLTGFFDSLTAGYSEYLTYRGLKPGKYAIVDTWTDEKTGHTHAQDGSITFVTVK